MAAWLAAAPRPWSSTTTTSRHPSSSPRGTTTSPWASSAPRASCADRAADRAGRGRLRLQRAASGRGRVRRHRRGAAVGRPWPRLRPSVPGAHRDRALTPAHPGARWLSVGRLAPNKAVEDTIAALAVARAHGDPDATLLVIGKPATASYVAALRRYVAELGLAAPCLRRLRRTPPWRRPTPSRRAGCHLRARGVLRPRGRGHVGRPARGGLDQGALPEVLGEAGVFVTARIPTGWPRIAALAGRRRRRARWPTAASAAGRARPARPRPTGSSTCSAPSGRRPAARPVVNGVHQFVPMLHRGDAVGRHTLACATLWCAVASVADLRRADRSRHGVRDESASAYLEPAGRRRAALPVRHGIAAGRLARRPAARPWWSTITTSRHPSSSPPGTTRWPATRSGPAELAVLAPRAPLAVAVSAHNEAELRAAGFRPPPWSHRPPCAALPGRQPAPRHPAWPGARWLSVGGSPPTRASSTP